jgi:hypothetical protein
MTPYSIFPSLNIISVSFEADYDTILTLVLSYLGEPSNERGKKDLQAGHNIHLLELHVRSPTSGKSPI